MDFQADSGIETVDLAGWKGGLNRQVDAFLLSPDESPEVLNVDFGLRGEISKRKGYVKWTTDGSPGYKEAFTLHGWHKLGAADFWVIVDADGEIWYDSDTTLNQVGAGSFGAPTDGRTFTAPAASMNDKLYLTTVRTGQNPQSFDGSSWTGITPTNFDGTASRFPRARSIFVAHDRMWAANVKSGGGTDFRSRLCFSDPLVPTTWQALDFIDFSPDDGSEITAALPFGEQIIIFKDTSMWVLAGTNKQAFTWFMVDGNLGTTAPGTIANSGAELIFFDPRSGVWSYDGSAYAKIDDKINAYLLGGINLSVAYKSSGFVFQGKYYLSVPWGGSSTPNRTFVYDARIQAWTEYDFGWFMGRDRGGSMFTVGAKNAVGIFQMWGVQADVGAAIPSLMTTAWLSPASPSHRHRLRRTDLAFSALGNFDVTVALRRDFEADDYKVQLVNTSPGGSLWDTATWDSSVWGSGLVQVLKRLSGWGERWRAAQMRISDTSSNPWELNRMVLQVSRLGRLKGES